MLLTHLKAKLKAKLIIFKNKMFSQTVFRSSRGEFEGQALSSQNASFLISNFLNKMRN